MKEPINIKTMPLEPPPSGLNLGDLYYILFRHKWKIVIIFIVGLLGAAGFYLTRRPLYESETKVLIHYVVEGRAPAGAGNDERIITPNADGQNIINSEVEILTSFDLVGQVADAVGPDRILARLGGGSDRMLAAAAVNSGLEVDGRRGNIIRIVFRHPDATVVQAVLNQLVDNYRKRHIEIHRGTAVRDTFFVQQADQLRNRIAQTEADLKKLKADAQVISLDVSKQAYTAAITTIGEQLRVAATELAERRATLNALSQTFPAQAGDTNALPPVPEAVSDRYRRVVLELADRQKQLSGERARFQEEHFSVRNLRRLVADLEAQKLTLEQAHPALTRLSPVVSESDRSNVSVVGLAEETRRVSALEARIKVLKEQMQQVLADATRVIDAEPAIGELTRKKMADEASLFSYSQSLERAHIEELLGAGKITNISVIQTPTPPVRNLKALKTPLMMLLAFACLGGIAWAIAVEKVLNQTVKRAVDLERLLPVPLFLSVPNLARRGGLRLPWFSRKAKGLHSPAELNGVGAITKEVAPWDPEHQLRPYYEGLRDRLITYFEVRNMNHKPKLIAVTGCNLGAGVTTMASGLAASLSETGDGNVLLVDMNLEQGAAHPFSQGKPCALSEALELATRSEALVQDNLYLVSAHETNDQKLPRVLPRRFASLVPKMKASDYDYIIFDMPPVTQTSVTARLSGFMDMVLMVVESEQTDQDILKRAHGLLGESNATVATILNKYRRYVPDRLSPQLS